MEHLKPDRLAGDDVGHRSINPVAGFAPVHLEQLQIDLGSNDRVIEQIGGQQQIDRAIRRHADHREMRRDRVLTEIAETRGALCAVARSLRSSAISVGNIPRPPRAGERETGLRRFPLRRRGK